jgi:large subunit ribosomal protein L17
MLANLASALIMHKRIETTLAKAKELRVYVEPLITKSKSDTTHSRRTVFSYLKNKYAVKELFSAVAEKIGPRPGGYTRILKTGFRHGDAAEMALIELVDFNGNYNITSKKSAAKKTTRRGSKKSTAAPETKTVAETPKTSEEPQTEGTPAPQDAAATPVEE